MPSHYDNTYHHTFSKPTYDREEDKVKYQTVREFDAVFEMQPARLPTREEEIAYIDWLAEDLRSDPFLSYRARKYMAGPKRVPWKNQREIKRQFQYTFFTHWLVGATLAWPLAVWVGRRMKHYQGGVPVVPYQRFVHDFPNVEPGR